MGFSSTLYLTLTVPRVYDGTASGLCGHLNGDKYNDLKLMSPEALRRPWVALHRHMWKRVWWVLPVPTWPNGLWYPVDEHCRIQQLLEQKCGSLYLPAYGLEGSLCWGRAPGGMSSIGSIFCSLPGERDTSQNMERVQYLAVSAWFWSLTD